MLTTLRKWIMKQPRTAWISHAILAEHEPGRKHPEGAWRIGAIEQELMRQKIWSQFKVREAEEVSDEQLALVHPRHYLRQLENASPAEGKIYRIDDDTVLCHTTLTAARFAAGAVVKAVDYVMNARAHNAFCAIRPPGHHAESAKAGGFCIINNVAVGAMHAIARYRLERVAIIDFDVHHGNGTAEIFQNDPRVLFFNSCEGDLYPFPDVQEYARNIVNLILPAHTTSQQYRAQVRTHWLPKLAAFQPQLILLSAGFDGHRDDDMGHFNLHEADFAWITHKIMQAAPQCHGKIVSALEGGYHLESLVKSVAAHLYVLAGMGKPECAVAYDKALREAV